VYNNINKLEEIIYFIFIIKFILIIEWGLGIGDWGLGNPQSPIPNPHKSIILLFIILKYN